MLRRNQADGLNKYPILPESCNSLLKRPIYQSFTPSTSCIPGLRWPKLLCFPIGRCLAHLSPQSLRNYRASQLCTWQRVSDTQKLMTHPYGEFRVFALGFYTNSWKGAFLHTVSRKLRPWWCQAMTPDFASTGRLR